jgi:transglutaminase-like putative cysteine protease
VTPPPENWNHWRSRSDGEKWDFLRSVPERDAQSPELLAIAMPLLQVAGASPWPRWAFVQLALCVARDLIPYMSDVDRVGREQIDGYTDPQGSTIEPLTRGADDCDAKARIFVALCLSVRIPAEMVPRWDRGRLHHVSARVLCETPLSKGRVQWLPVETILDRARLGDVAEGVPVEIDTGHWAQTTLRQVG